MRAWRGYDDRGPRRYDRAPEGYDRADFGGGARWPRGWEGAPPPWATPHVTLRYNRDYVHPGPRSRPRNYIPYGGEIPGQIVDASGYWRPYLTVGGTRTLRGGNLPVGWESERPRRGHDRPFGGYGPRGGYRFSR